ncbi:MAG: hypothetical protein U0636_08910 [Phycisphaerales bacterium]
MALTPLLVLIPALLQPTLTLPQTTPAPGQQSGGGSSGGGGGGGGYGYGGSGGGVGANGQAYGYTSGGEMSAQASEAAALAPAYHFHQVGTTSAQAVGSGGGPPLSSDETPGYVQAKFVTPTGTSYVNHCYRRGMPPPLGRGGPNDGNPAGGNYIANGTVAGNPGLVNWGLTPSYEAEESGNWAGLGQQGSDNPMPYVGSFND